MQSLARIFPLLRAFGGSAALIAGVPAAASMLEAQTPGAEPAATVSRAAVDWISRFENPIPDAMFGAGWGLSSDQSGGGRSRARFHVVEKGVNGSAHALRIEGTVDPGLPYAWAGVSFYPGEERYAPADISSKDSLTFWARGDGGSYRVIFLADAADGREARAERRFVTSGEWQLVSVPLKSIRGVDFQRVKGISFVAGPRPGDFMFELDDVRLR